jgi:DNA polymerase-3 subunit gamma/tau
LNLSRAVLDGEIQAALTQLNDLAQGGKDLGRLLSDLLNHFRNLLIYQISRGDMNLLEVSEAETAALKEQSALADSDAFTRILEVFAGAELDLRDAASKKIFLEVALLKAIEARSAVSLDAVLRQLNQLRGGQNSNAATPAPAAANVISRTSPPIESPQTKNPPLQAAVHNSAGTAPVSDGLAGLWTRLIEAVGRASPFTRSYLVDANPVSFEKNILVIGFDPEFQDHLGLVDNARNHALLQTKLAELGHAGCQIKFIKAEAPAGQITRPAMPVPAAPSAAPAAGEKKSAPVPFNKETFKNDPLIQKALEIFKGQIIEVRA